MVKKIVILGGGFAGIRVAQDLVKLLERVGFSQAEIALVDKETTHLFRADLYEVATAFNEKITDKCMLQLKETVATPIHKLINHKWVEFLNDEVVGIDNKEKIVHLKNRGDLKYDYLVVALGSETNYFGIKGLKENSFAMKTIHDGLRINCHLDQFFKDLWQKKSKMPVFVTVGGGGANGVETVAEMVGSLKKLAKKYSYDFGKISVQLIEGSEKLAGLDSLGTAAIRLRLKKLGVKIYTQCLIQEVNKKEIVVKNEGGKIRKIRSDILIWTGGVMVNPVVQKYLGAPSEAGQGKRFGGAILTNPYLQSVDDQFIFAAGDNAYFVDPSNQKMRLPMMAQIAIQEGESIAKNLFNCLHGKVLEEFLPLPPKLFLPLGGKYAVLKWGKYLFKGFWLWVIRRFIVLRYSLSILPFWSAMKKWLRSTDIFMDND